MNPEFLREGSSIADFHAPPYDGHRRARPRAAATSSRRSTRGSPRRSFGPSSPYAEMVKYTGNAYHGLKVTFANEIGNICKRLGLGRPRGDGDLLPR